MSLLLGDLLWHITEGHGVCSLSLWMIRKQNKNNVDKILHHSGEVSPFSSCRTTVTPLRKMPSETCTQSFAAGQSKIKTRFRSGSSLLYKFQNQQSGVCWHVGSLTILLVPCGQPLSGQHNYVKLLWPTTLGTDSLVQWITAVTLCQWKRL